jgi:GR25 family glycosyltransferase involved in LPS biosynthesis
MAKIYYINLDSREDRKALTESELSRTGIPFERVSAIKKTDGQLGCCLSHIKALNLAYSEGHDDVIIVEDDIVFETDPTQLLEYVVRPYIGRPFNLILLSYHLPLVNLYDFATGVASVSNAQTTTAYLVKRSYIPTLLENFSETVSLLEKGVVTAIDQNWKKLQHQFVAAIPRLAKQRNSFSDIEGKAVSYGGFVAMGILSCHKYESRRKTQDLDNCPFIHNYFIGRQSSEDCVSLPCGDDYEDLPQKTKAMIAWHLDTYPHLDYLFKTDDDIVFNFEELHKLAVQVCLAKVDYAGLVASVRNDYISNYHVGRTNKKVDKQVLKRGYYAAGGGYFLSRKAMEAVYKHIDSVNSIFEDYAVGASLQKAGIKLNSLEIKKGCKW